MVDCLYSWDIDLEMYHQSFGISEWLAWHEPLSK
jgi:hypothetical protein